MNIEKIVLNILNDDVFSYSIYNDNMIKSLLEECQKIYEKLSIYSKDKYLLSRKIELFLRTEISLRMKYFDFYNKKIQNITKEELQYRTSYAALVKKETTCHGYSEVARILFSLFNIDNYTILAKLPGKKYKIVHYSTIITIDNNNYIIDPERYTYCLYKKQDFDEYISNIIFMKPDYRWKREKLNNYGVGPLVEEYMQENNIIKNIKIKVLK